MKNIIFRCHSVGDLMGKSGLGKTGQKRAIYTYIENTDGRYREIKSKYLEKGILNESGAIELVNEVLGVSYQKNDVRLTNDYLTGECDLEDDEQDEITDIKCSWDRFTFEESKVGEDYEWQLRGYMELYNKEKARVIYCLTDAPDHLILKELERASNQFNGDLPDLIAIRIVVNMIFDRDNFNRFLEIAPIDLNKVQKQINNFVHIPKDKRVHYYGFKRDAAKTKLLYYRIDEARKFLSDLYES
jgi:hypothetical protein